MTPLSADPFTLDDPRVAALDHLLEQRAVAHGGMGLEQLDGFLSALVVGPGLVPPSEWQPRVWGKTPPRWENPEEAAEAQAMLMALWNTAARRVRFDGDDLPMECLPFWWLPEDPEAEHGDDVDIGAAWAAGFLEGMDARSDAWDAWIGNDDWIGDIEAHLEALAVGNYLAEDGGSAPMPLTYRQRLEIYASLPDMLHDLHCHRIEQLTPREPVRRADEPGRNDLCPCGSGRKFKKCCGAPERLN